MNFTDIITRFRWWPRRTHASPGGRQISTTQPTDREICILNRVYRLGGQDFVRPESVAKYDRLVAYAWLDKRSHGYWTEYRLTNIGRCLIPNQDIYCGRCRYWGPDDGPNWSDGTPISDQRWCHKPRQSRGLLSTEHGDNCAAFEAKE